MWNPNLKSIKCSAQYFYLSSGSQERKLQRRSVRSRSESERGTDPVPKKKTKKDQVSFLFYARFSLFDYCWVHLHTHICPHSLPFFFLTTLTNKGSEIWSTIHTFRCKNAAQNVVMVKILFPTLHSLLVEHLFPHTFLIIVLSQS